MNSFQKNEPEDQDQEDDNNAFEESFEPFEIVAVTDSIKAELPPEEDIKLEIKPQPKKQRAKKGSLKKAPPLLLNCDRCPEVFQDITQFNAHKRIHDGLLPFVCEICKDNFSSLLDMQLHKVQIHTESPTVPCDHPGCNEVFANHRSLRSHHWRVHDPNYVEPEASTFICEVCANAYTSKESLKRHRYSHTPEEMPYICSFCPRRFSSLHALKQHLNRHNGVKNHICPHCGVRKTTRNELRSHMNNIHKKDHEPLDMASTHQPFFETETPTLPKTADNWKRTVRKQNRNSGKAYISTNNVLIPGKSFPENFSCGCPKKCPSLFSSQAVLQEFFHSYWNLADWHKQNVLLQEMVTSVEIARRRSKTGDPSARTKNFHYFIPDRTDKIRVCKRYFLGVLQISWGRVYRWAVKKDEPGDGE